MNQRLLKVRKKLSKAGEKWQLINAISNGIFNIRSGPPKSNYEHDAVPF